MHNKNVREVERAEKGVRGCRRGGKRHQCFVTLSAVVTSLCSFPEDGTERGGPRGVERVGGQKNRKKLRRGEKWLSP